MADQPFVARERELAQLNDFLDRALAGHGQVVFVSGEAGTGKTALVTEFARRAQDAHDDLLVAVGQGDAQTGAGDPYLPFREVLGLLTGDVDAKLAQGAITQENAGRLRDFLRISGQALVEYGPDLIDIFVPGVGLATRAGTFVAGKVGWLDRLEDLTDRKADGLARGSDQGLDQIRIFEQYTNVLRALAAERPLIVVVDDLQWADAASIDLLFRLGRQIEDSRILLVGTYRPDDVALGRSGQRHPLEPVLNELKRYYGDVVLDLAQSGATAGRHFIDAYLDAEPNRLSEDFRQALFEHTGGHPLFTVELLHAMQVRADLVRDEQERWVVGPNLDWTTLPAQIEGVIDERIGRLDDELRETLTTASVEGEDFTAEVVARVQAADERGLVRRLSRELDKQHRLVGAQEQRRVGRQRLSLYRFRHNLFQRYLYNSLDEIDRSYLHEDVGTVLEELYGDQAHEIAVQLARHFSEAGLDDKALTYLIQAGDRAARQYANTEAVAYYTRALEIARREVVTTEQLINLYLSRGRTLELDNQVEEALSNYREMESQAERLGERALRLASLNAQSTLYAVPSPVSNAEQAGFISDKALVLARELGDRVAEAKALWNLMLVYRFGLGEAQQAADFGEAALEIARTLDPKEQLAYILGDLAVVYGHLGDYPRGRMLLDEAREYWRELNNLPMLANTLVVLSRLAYEMGDFEGAVEAAGQGIEVAEASGNVVGQILARSPIAFLYRDRGDYETVFRFVKTGLHLAREHGLANWIAPNSLYLALAYGDLGQVEPALALCGQALEYIDAAPSILSYPEFYHILQANLLLSNGDLAGAQEALGNCASGISMIGNATPASLIWPAVVCAVALAAQEYDHLINVTDEIIARFEQVGIGAGLPEVRYFKAKAHLARGEFEVALRELDQASAEAARMGARRILWQILAALAELEDERGQAEQAANLRAQAREVIEYIADHAGSPELRASFLSRPDVRALALGSVR